MSLGIKRKRDDLEGEIKNAEKKLKSEIVIWRTIPEAPEYEMSNLEQVRKIDSQHLLKRTRSGNWNIIKTIQGVKVNDKVSHTRLYYSCFPEIVNAGAIWKQIIGYPNYEVSERGDVRGPNKTTLKPQHHIGYATVKLKNEKKKKHFFIHTLVALAFIGPKPSEKHSVNHKNAIKTDNRACNLEWATQKQQVAHAVQNALIGGPRADSVKVHQFKKTGELVLTYESISDAARAILVGRPTTKLITIIGCITSVCDSKRPTYAGFKWQYARAKVSKILADVPEEKWLICKDTPKYEVSCLGNVRNVRFKRAVSFQISAGYFRVALSASPKRVYIHVHILVARTFIVNDDPIHKTMVDHINGNKQDNRVENLQWLTPQQNTVKSCGRKISKVNDAGQVLATYASVTEAARVENYVLSTFETHIRKGIAHGGFTWRDTEYDDVVMQ